MTRVTLTRVGARCAAAIQAPHESPAPHPRRAYESPAVVMPAVVPMSAASPVSSFTFDGAPVCIVLIDGESHFIGKDVAERLGYADATNAMKQDCKGVVKRHRLLTAGGTQEARVLSEPDVLRLIMGSRLPAAER